jgi:hypothetical protein
MESPTYLQPSKTGRSRFSKALPPAPLEVMSSRTMTPVIVPSNAISPLSPAARTKELPALPPLPPKNDQASSEATSPQLPALPFMQALAPIGLPATPKAPPPMAIPRRPIGKPVLPQEPEHSPTESLSSLLSAYSRSSGESLIRYSDGSASSKGESEPTLSPTREDMDGKLGDISPQVLSSAVFNPKEMDRPRIETKNLAGQPQQKNDAIANGAQEQAVSQTSPQIWRRRSLKSNQNLEVTALKLDTASVAATDLRDLQGVQGLDASATARTPVTAAQNSPARPLQPPFAYGLPGKDIRPSAAKTRNIPTPRDQASSREEDRPSQLPSFPQPPQRSQPEASTQPQVPPKRPDGGSAMGSKVSVLKERFQRREAPTAAEQTQFPPRSASRRVAPAPAPSPAVSSNRPPTPEYTRHEVEVPVVDHIVSPVSPAASPELPEDAQGSDAAAPAVYGSNEPARRPLRERDLHAARSLSEMKPAAVQPTSSEKPPAVPGEYATPASQDAESRADRQEAAPSRDRQQAEQNFKFPPRTTSIRQPNRQLLNTSASMQDMRPSARSQGQYQAYQPGMPADGGTQLAKRPQPTVYRDANQDDLPPPDPRAAYFPLRNEQGDPINPPMSPATVFRAPKLTTAHYECFSRHSQMVVSRNKAYALSCQACNIEDSEMRWQCSWCRLRICGRCARALQRLDRDLPRLLDYVEKNPPGSGISSRPSTGSGGGLEKVEESPETESPETESPRPREAMPNQLR